MSDDLVSWGLDDERRAEAGGAEIGRVVRVDRGECDLITAAGALRVASDSMRAQSEVAPATGDWVTVRHDDGLGPVIARVLERRTSISRRDPAKRDIEQVLGANVDVVAAVHGLDRSLPAGRLERLLVLAEDGGARPAVVLTKSDMVERGDVAEVVADVRAIAGPHIEIAVTSAVNESGAHSVRGMIGEGRTLMLIGPSGVGKSTLVNELLGEEVQATGDVRSSDARGRHTTTARELVLLGDRQGMVLDTPGIRGVGLWDAEEALRRVFAELDERASQCRFGDCGHRVEPGCAIRAGVEAGELDGRRVDRYLDLTSELAELAEREAHRRRRGGR